MFSGTSSTLQEITTKSKMFNLSFHRASWWREFPDQMGWLMAWEFLVWCNFKCSLELLNQIISVWLCWSANIFFGTKFTCESLAKQRYNLESSAWGTGNRFLCNPKPPFSSTVSMELSLSTFDCSCQAAVTRRKHSARSRVGTECPARRSLWRPLVFTNR